MGTVWFQTLAVLIILSVISLIGVFSLSLKKEALEGVLLLLVSFAVGGLFGDVFLHLLPEVVGTTGFTLATSFFILLGVLIFFTLEKFISWRHCHVPTSVEHPHPVALMNLIGDGAHNFLDGAIIAASFLASFPLGVATSVAVIFHEIPQEIGDFGVLIHGGFTRQRALLFNFLSSLAAIFGAFLVLIFGLQTENFANFLIPLTAGGFIYIAGSDLIPELHKETAPQKSFLQFLGILLGLAVMAVLKLFA